MTAFELSKPFLDVGLFTNQERAMRDFYARELALPPIDTQDIEPGYVLHRYDAQGSALKINALDETLDRATTGLRRILIARPEQREPVTLTDPDGLIVTLVPPGHEDVVQVGIVWAVPAPAKAAIFAERALGAERLASGRYRVGETTIFFEEDPALVRMGSMETVGFTYTTLHVRDVLGAHAHLVASGCDEAIPPTPFGDVTTYSFVRDPFGNWIEVSQRADLAGAVARVDGPVLSQDEVRALRRAR